MRSEPLSTAAAPASGPDAAGDAARRRAPWIDDLPAPLRKPLARVLRPGPKVNVVRLYGAIGVGARGTSLTDEALARPIEAAFSGKPAAVALAINSPGGSPVQSSLIAARIRRLAEEKEVPVLAFVEDAAASGGYWLACAADEIFADRSSLVGSIGVIYAGFGFQDLMARWGVERRVHTAGTRKLILDPFQPEKAEDVADLEAIQAEVHDAFVSYVRARRGEALQRAEAGGGETGELGGEGAPDLFSGAVFLGARAERLGLIDGLGHLSAVLKARFGEDVRVRDYGLRRPFLSRLGLGAAAADALGALEARALAARLGG